MGALELLVQHSKSSNTQPALPHYLKIITSIHLLVVKSQQKQQGFIRSGECFSRTTIFAKPQQEGEEINSTFVKKGHLEKADSCSKREEVSRRTTATSHLKPQFIEQIQVEKYLKLPFEEQGMVFSSEMVKGKARWKKKIIECLGLEGTLKLI